MHGAGYMPAALDVNWPAIRALAVMVGVREAARQSGVNEDSAMARSAREGWLKSLPKDCPLPPRLGPIQARESNGTFSPHIAAQNALQTIGQQTRASLARGIAKGAAHVETLDGESVLTQARNISQIAKAASDVHGWSGTAGVAVSLRVGLLGSAGGDDGDPAPLAIECESEVVEDRCLPDGNEGAPDLLNLDSY